MDDTYLERIRIDAFGKFIDKQVGPFAPGLNVVYGENEAGKTTVSAFVGGVLLGWENAPDRRNVYKPAHARRSGSLQFRDRAGEVHEISRGRLSEGESYSSSTAREIASSVDRSTFRAMFSLNSDELLGLERVSNMGPELSTAGAGTDVSPADALRELDARIERLTGGESAPRGLLRRIQEEEEECRLRLAAARVESDSLKADMREYRELLLNRAKLSRAVDEANEEVETLSSCETEAARLEERIESARSLLARCDESLAKAVADRDALNRRRDARLADGDALASASRAVERLEREMGRMGRRITAAQDEFDKARSEEQAGASLLAGSSAYMIPLGIGCFALCLVGAVLFMKGLTESDGTLVVSALLIAACAFSGGSFVVAQRRKAREQAKSPEEAESRLVRARRMLELCEQDELVFSLRVQEELSALGLGDAQGSLPHARAMLDSVRVLHESLREAIHQVDVLEQRRKVESEAIEASLSRRANVFAAAGLEESQGVEGIRQALEAASLRRSASLDALRESDVRIGELKQRLAAGERSSEFDRLKIRRAEVATRKREAVEELAVLLLARRQLAAAVDAWKSDSAPEVYARASRLLSLMTGGRWVEVRMDDEGEIFAIDASRSARASRMLSTGTCQQLYLALRIALLECIDGMGSAIPVLADDILVNFDNERRKGAIRALSRLSRTRQVIIFTCHEEILEGVRQYADGHTLVAL